MFKVSYSPHPTMNKVGKMKNAYVSPSGILLEDL